MIVSAGLRWSYHSTPSTDREQDSMVELGRWARQELILPLCNAHRSAHITVQSPENDYLSFSLSLSLSLSLSISLSL